MKPVIALVGRPNVGKSTLFNRLTQTRDAIVADFAGLTRDRHYGNGRQGKHEFIVIDTGGFEPDAEQRHLQGDGQADAAGGGRSRRGDLRGRCARGPVGAGPRHRQRPAPPGQALRAGGQQGRGHDTTARSWSSSTSSGLGEVHGVSAAHGQGIREPGRTGARAAEPARARRGRGGRRRTRPHQAGGRRPAQRRQVDADQHLAGRGAPGRLRPAGHHARRDLGAVRAQRPELRADRHGRPAPQGQGVRGDREVLGGQDAAGHRDRPTSCCCCSTPPRA